MAERAAELGGRPGHPRSTFSKLHVGDRAAAVARARDAGYGQRSR